MGLIRFSRRVFARKAVKFALSRRGDFVNFVNEKIDLPVLDETQEAALFTSLVESSLTAIDALLGGDLSAADESILSKRAVVANALDFAAGHVADFMGEGIDIPGVPESAELFIGEALERFLVDVAIPWSQSTPLLD